MILKLEIYCGLTGPVPALFPGLSKPTRCSQEVSQRNPGLLEIGRAVLWFLQQISRAVRFLSFSKSVLNPNLIISAFISMAFSSKNRLESWIGQLFPLKLEAGLIRWNGVTP